MRGGAFSDQQEVLLKRKKLKTYYIEMELKKRSEEKAATGKGGRRGKEVRWGTGVQHGATEVAENAEL